MVDEAGCELLTAAQMRAIERVAIESDAVTGLELMERAGRSVVEAVFAEWPELAASPHRAVVLCGPGNNGGDGFVVARLLRGWGWEVDVFLYGDPGKLPPDARVNYDRWCECGEVACRVPDPGALRGCALIVDACFGTGLTRPLPAEIAQLAQALAAEGKGDEGKRGEESVPALSEHVVAVDIPSGLCADSGRGLGGQAPIPAALTVTFHAAKCGHYLGAGPDACGRLVCADIGLGDGGWRGGAQVRMQGGPGAGLSKRAGSHKYAHGHALILAGGPGRGGAARLAARGALRIGAGLVTVGCPQEALAENAAQLTAVMLRAIGDADALERVLTDARINALCLGPGLGVGAETRALVRAALAADRAVVLDADALTSFAVDPGGLFDAVASHRAVLTPHGGEFARLFPDIAAKLAAPALKGPAYSKLDATREAAVRAGCVVLFKGADTVIAAPDGQCRVHAATYDRAAPWLATAGAGDVLAGFIAGLLARGLDSMQAAGAAAWLHVEAARSFGPGLIAEDLSEELPRVFRRLGL